MIYLIIYLSVWFFTNFEPIQELIDNIFNKIKPNYFTKAIWSLLSCQYCSTLWITLILTGSIVMALSLSVIAQIHKKIIE